MIINQLHSSRLLIIRQITEKSIINRLREEERRTREGVKVEGKGEGEVVGGVV